ncbi:MAG: TolC family protein, partial [Roseibacillus sp.]|nr:TolC family protein [Roseibacillus sp.]
MSERRSMAAVLGLVILATGCAVRPPESRIGKISAGAPERWIASKAAKAGIDQDWIKRFGDSQLVALVDESMKNNPDLRIAAERVRRAEAVARLSGAARKVQVSGKINGQLQKQRFPGFPLNLGSNTAEVYGASLDVNWELDLWGRLRATQRAAMADKQAQEQDYRAARTSLAAQLAKAWFALGEANEQIGLAQAAILVRDKTARSIRERFTAALEGGLASQLRLAETDLAGSRAALARWQAERERALRQVELLVGRYPKGNLLSRRVLPKAPAAPPAGLASELLLRRPDILAAERRYAAA